MGRGTKHAVFPTPLALLFVPLAHAHPATSGVPGATRDVIGQRLEVRLLPAEVEVEYVAEVPQRRVWAEAKADGAASGWADARLEELAGGLTVLWDGAPLATEAIALEDPARAGENGFVELRVARRAALPDDEGTLSLRNANFPDERCFFATEVEVSGALVVTETSLLRVKDGRLRDNRHGAWVREEAAREPKVTVRRATLFERAEGTSPLPTRMQGIVRDAPPWWVHVLGVLGLAGLAVAGRALGLRARRRA